MTPIDLDTLLRLDPAARGPRPAFLGTGEVDSVLKLALALAQELAVTRQRLDTLERQLLLQQTLPPAALDPAEQSAEVTAAQATWQREFLQRLLRTLGP